MKEFLLNIPIKLRICICVFLSGLLSVFIGFRLPLINFGATCIILGGMTTTVGFISLLIYWATWADR